MTHYFDYKSNADNNSLNRIGGGALIPLNFEWPTDNTGSKMLLLATISDSMLKKECGIILPKNNVLSIFVPYHKNDIECAISLARGRERGHILFHEHEPHQGRQEFGNPLIPAKEIKINEEIETDEDEFSDEVDDKIGGNPIWLQDRIDYHSYNFVLQISGATIQNSFPDHKGIFMAGFLYVFFDPAKNAGFVSLQYS